MHPVVQEALKHLGTHDGTPFLKFLGIAPPAAWCCAFMIWCQHVVHPQNHWPRTARVYNLWERTQDDPRFLTFTPEDVSWGIARPQAGDVIVFAHNPAHHPINWQGHTGFVVEDLGRGRVATVEGNTSCPGGPQDERNGNCVARKVRQAGIQSFLLEGFVRERR